MAGTAVFIVPFFQLIGVTAGLLLAFGAKLIAYLDMAVSEVIEPRINPPE
jgi:hypothetical protein